MRTPKRARRGTERTLGYVGVTLIDGKLRFIDGSRVTETPEEIDIGTALDSDDGRRTHRVARVVLVPAKAKRRSKR